MSGNDKALSRLRAIFPLLSSALVSHLILVFNKLALEIGRAHV